MALRSGMWAVVFTDLVGSTEQRARLGDRLGDELRRDHDAVVASTAAAHGGHVVKGTGDGTMVAFSGAADALAAAVEVQQGIERRNRDASEPLELRIGISLGDLVHESDDLHGLAANEAARICAAAEGGEILASEVVKMVAGSRTECRFLERTERELRGLAQPVVTWRVDWTPTLPATFAPARPLVVSSDAMAFAGRDEELRCVLEAWEDAKGGSCRAVFVSGEPGIGKTRLVVEAARVALEQEALVLFGRCDDQLGVSFQPFTEMLDWYLEHAEGITLGRFPGDLARLSSRVRERAPHVPEPLTADPETEQFRLFDAVAGWLVAVAAEAPVVVVVDDVHWATRPTLLMLRHVLTKCESAPLLVLVTYRDTDLDRQHPLSAMLADFRRLPGVERLALSGLDQASVSELLELVGNQRLDDEARVFARMLVSETEGNPFFIGEILRHLRETGALVRREGRWTSAVDIADVGIPEGIKEVLGQRLDRLGADATVVLQAAAVVGREFDFDVVSAVAGFGDADALAAIERAVAARLVEESGIDRYRFAHALVHSALEDELTSARRVRLHARIAEHLERVHPDRLMALADHWLAAAFAGEPAKAVSYAIAAADHAHTGGAFDEAAAILTRACELADQELPDDEIRRELRVRLGTSQRLAGNGEFRATLLAVARDAEEAGDADVLVRAAQELSRGLWSNSFFVDDERVAVCESALAALGDSRPADRARLLATLAAELTFSPYERRRDLVVAARHLARASSDSSLIVDVDALSVWALWGDPTNTVEALVGLAHSDLQPDPTRRFLGLEAQRIIAMIRGDHARGLELLDAERSIVADVPFGLGRWQCALQDFLLAQVAGDLPRAEACADAALAIGTETGQPDALVVGMVQLEGVRQDRGDDARRGLDQMRTFVEQFADAAGGNVFRAGLAVRLAELGEYDEARALVAAEHERRFEYFEWTVVSQTYWAAFAEAALDVGDRSAASLLYERLSVYRDQSMYVSGGTIGAASRVLGRLATSLGRFELAEQHLASAAAMHERMQAPLLLARTWADQAELVLASTTDAARARALVERAASTCRDLGAFGVERYVRRVLERAGLG